LALAVPPKQEGELSEAYYTLISAVTPPYSSKVARTEQTFQVTTEGDSPITQCESVQRRNNLTAASSKPGGERPSGPELVKNPHRYRPGTVALREIRLLQKT
jgi:hypothetical protein